jgi:hypothetical protein
MRGPCAAHTQALMQTSLEISLNQAVPLLCVCVCVCLCVCVCVCVCVCLTVFLGRASSVDRTGVLGLEQPYLLDDRLSIARWKLAKQASPTHIHTHIHTHTQTHTHTQRRTHHTHTDAHTHVHTCTLTQPSPAHAARAQTRTQGCEQPLLQAPLRGGPGGTPRACDCAACLRSAHPAAHAAPSLGVPKQRC